MNTLLDCGHVPSEHGEHTTGYGEDGEGKRHCYACCAEQDKASMRDTGRATLYLVKEENGTTYKVTNWPGSLSLACSYPRKSWHNIARNRYDVWFNFEGTPWHGVQYGDNTQIVRCRRTKS